MKIHLISLVVTLSVIAVIVPDVFSLSTHTRRGDDLSTHTRRGDDLSTHTRRGDDQTDDVTITNERIVASEYFALSEEHNDVLDTYLANGTLRGRMKRAIKPTDYYRWDKGILPFRYDSTISSTQRGELQAVMKIFEESTCIRFVPYKGRSTNERLGLGHYNYISYTDGSSCYSCVGNSGNDGCEVSCCSRSVMTCTHELGHALGMYHEQGSPDPAVRWQIGYRNARNSKSSWSADNEAENLVGYSISSTMQFSQASVYAFTKFYPEMEEETGWYYMLMEISMAHRCDELHCSDSRLVCHNDGFLTLVDGRCSCKCPDGLVGDSGCREVTSRKDGCGEYHELTDGRTQVKVTAPAGRSSQECTWFFSAPEGRNLRLSFEQHDVDCSNPLSLRYFRPGQQALPFCGSQLDRTFQSMNNTIAVTMPTGSTSSSFRATATLTVDADMCYAELDRGTTYVGKVSFTRHFEPCLPWEEVTHCPYHQYSLPFSGLASSVLEGNYCRNPDFATGKLPWCYTNKLNCKRNYCDPCLFGTTYDAIGQCDRVSCDTSSDILGCAKTCKFDKQMPQVPKIDGVRCPAPQAAQDGSPVGIGQQSTFRVGDKVTYQCTTAPHITRHRFCLTSGQWSPMGFVCDVCPDGWYYEKSLGLCALLVYDKVTRPEAKAACEAMGVTLALVKTPEVSKFVLYILEQNFNEEVWIGLSKASNGKYVWDDGDSLDWDNWDGGARRDCVIYNMDGGVFEDAYCETNRRGEYTYPSTYSYVCTQPATRTSTCADFLDNCQELFIRNTTICEGYDEFATRMCPFTCGICEKDSTPRCSVDSAPSNGRSSENSRSIQRGEMVEYSCKDGYAISGGDALRGCLANGQLSGSRLTCKTASCPDRSWKYVEDFRNCYKFFRDSVEYEEAVSSCLGYGSYVVMPKTIEENAKVVDIANYNDKFHIGLRFSHEIGAYVWTDGEVLSAGLWGDSEPDGRDCTVLQQDDHGTWGWGDNKCVDKTRPYMCQVTIDRPDSCPVKAPVNGKASTTDTEVDIGDTVDFTCDDGYVVEVGDTRRTCLTTGRLGGVSVVCSKAMCPDGWMFSGPESNLCYLGHDQYVEYDDAVKVCEKLDIDGRKGSLAMPKSDLENNKVLQARATDDRIWLGLRDDKKEGVYVWDDGEPLGWSNWYGGQPRDNDRDANCVRMIGEWKPKDCDSRYRFVCQVPVVPATTTTTSTTPTTTTTPLTTTPLTTTTSTTTTRTTTSSPTTSTTTSTEATTTSTTTSPSDCPAGWRYLPSTDTCYGYIREFANYTAAASRCSSMGSLLAMPKSLDENDLLVELVGYPQFVYIGLDDEDTEGNFVWADGQTLSGWSNWDSGEPNDFDGLEDCVLLQPGKSGMWKDTPCLSEHHFLCQTVPECLVDPPPTHGNSSTDLDTVPLGTTVTYSCDAGYVVSSGDPVRTCSADGNLTGDPITCSKECPPGWLPSSDYRTCYKGIAKKLTYEGAWVACGRLGASLAMPRTAEDHDRVMAARTGQVNVWIGLDDVENESVFKWAGGGDLDGWTNWGSSQPNNAGKGEDCVVIFNLTGMWDDLDCGRKMSAVCQANADTCQCQ